MFQSALLAGSRARDETGIGRGAASVSSAAVQLAKKIFGGLDRFKTKEELLDEELAKFISIHKPDSQHMPLIRQFFKAYITDNEVRDIVEKREFNRLATNAKVNLADFKALNSWRDVIPEYVKDYVQLNQFM